ncbi:MAG TPA: cobalt-precorrin 5A hydrolase [Methylomusa anaerophila]|uniref:Cobalamin biosynthesis protein CbiG n=1 Tax=Methylomusa anaerophila TaxID=1930071 RepID=A0A348AQE3_9FIRM|nr:cobalt-precorrin 5A hydrolase [Methylomusa anaerophila]BBB93291.1 cobalamin biosynthesis protein CbiG [Methylomusa anaerophila]HML86878.1 cobalt-precorrin 5A hydrolase [Methylomusa anaerophila]
MKLALISVTRKGAALAERLVPFLGPDVDVYAKEGRDNVTGTSRTYDCLSQLVDTIFHKYDGFVFIMAAGIVVRIIAHHIRDKRFDPAVVVVDDGGKHAISLLSGHIGGANDLTLAVSEAIGASPVITTATDVAQLPAADVLAVKLNLLIEPFPRLKVINAAIANGDRVVFFIDKSLADYEHYLHLAAEYGIILQDAGELEEIDHYDAAVIITDQEYDTAKPCLFLRPGSLALGIGCRRGTTDAELFGAISDACRKIGKSWQSVAVLGSSVVKQDEIGLLALGQQLDVPVEFFSNEQLRLCIAEKNYISSSFVEQQIGVGNVCEPAAILAGQSDRLLLPKTKYAKVTVAIAPVKYRWWE